MRILVLNQYFHPDQSATAQLLTELCEDLSRHHEVFVVTGRPSYNPTAATPSTGILSRESHGAVQVRRVWSTSFDRSWVVGRLINYGTYVATSVLGALSIRSPDVVVGLTDPPPIGLVASLVARVRRVPFVLVTKDIFPDVAISLGKLRNQTVIRVLRAISTLLFRSANAIVSIGRDMNRRLESLGVPRQKITTINDWADTDAVRPLGFSQLRAELGWQDRFVVMHSGNVGLSQDLETVIEAASLVSDMPEFLIAIVGEGASKRRLQQDLEERGLKNVVFLPYQPKERLSESLGAADVHLVTLRRGLAGYIVPSKVYGIMAVGKPFIAAVEPWSEPALILEEQGCGVRIEPGDAQALVGAIKQIRIKQGVLSAMGRRARAAAEARFDRARAAASYLALLEQQVEER